MDMSFVKDGDVKTVVEKLLFSLGFQNRLVGTNYLAEAITLKYSNKGMRCLDVYTQVAKTYSATPGSVEHAIRHTINNCRAEGGITDFNDVIGCNVIDRKFTTTSGEFISIVEKWLTWMRSNDDDNEKNK